MPVFDYSTWISHSETTARELVAMGRQIPGFARQPQISLLFVVSDPDEVWIKNTLDSVRRQIYPRLEVCVCDNGSERAHVGGVLEGYAAVDERIKIERLPEKKSWAEAHNAALSSATGEFVAVLGQGDELAPDAMFRVAHLLQDVRADVVYTDEDHVDISGERSDPSFKPYWSPELLLSRAYIGRLCAMRRSAVEAAGGFREGLEGAEEHDLILRLSEETDRIYHVPGVLYHRSRWPGPTPDGDRTWASSRAVEDTINRRGEDATVEPAGSAWRVNWRLSGRPRVSVIVSAPEGAPAASSINQLKRRTSHPIDQLIVASNAREASLTGDHVGHPFPARAMNLAAARADGEYLVFVSDRTQITSSGWLEELLAQAQRQGVGAAGCKLLTAEGMLRHGGSFTNLGWLVGYANEREIEEDQALLWDPMFNFEVASAECMVVRKAAFEDVGGFDDERLPTALYDLDLSFRLQEKGLRNVYSPYASLVCEAHELSPSVKEITYVWERWWERLIRASYYQRSPLHSNHRPADREALLATLSS